MKKINWPSVQQKVSHAKHVTHRMTNKIDECLRLVKFTHCTGSAVPLHTEHVHGVQTTKSMQRRIVPFGYIGGLASTHQ